MTWYPIATWSEAQVWERIGQAGTRHHEAYDLGMPRLSCVFCIFAPRKAMTLAGRHNRELLQRYADLERSIDHKWRTDFSLADVVQDVDAGVYVDQVSDWDDQA